MGLSTCSAGRIVGASALIALSFLFAVQLLRLRLRHSQQRRLLQDLPVQSIPMILRLHLGRWRCRHAGCER